MKKECNLCGLFSVSRRNSNVGASALGAIKIMLFVLKQAIINRAEGERSYIPRAIPEVYPVKRGYKLCRESIS